MADIKFHRSGGFIFNNIKIDNTNDIYLLGVEKTATPKMNVYNFVVPSRNGSTSYKNRYDDKYIRVVVGLYDKDIITRRLKQRQLIGSFINVNSKLYFLDEPNLYYNAEIFDEIGITETEVFTELSIIFKCSYCLYKNNPDVIWTNTTVSTIKEIINEGNFEADTLFKIKANNACTNVVIANETNSFTLSNLIANDEIYVDSKNMIVYKINNLNEKVNCMTMFSGKFIKLSKGKSIISVNGTNFNVDVTLTYLDTYIC